MLVRSLTISTLALGAALLGGCSDSSSLSSVFGGNTSSNLTTASVLPATPKADPACPALASQIDSLRKDGIADKIEKASQKKYKMTTAELLKADQLNKVNADFQTRCSNYKPAVTAATVAPAAPSAASTPATPAAATNAVATAATNATNAVTAAATTTASAAKP